MKILFQGDSITDAGRTGTANPDLELGRGYPMLLTSLLSRRSPGEHRFFNRGIGGNRIVDVYARAKKDIWNLEPDVMSILIGVNDVWHEILETPNGVDVERFERIYRMLLSDTLERLPNLKILLMEPYLLPGSASEGCWEWFRSEVEARAAVVRKLADEFGLPFVPLQAVLDEAAAASGPAIWAGDGVHPTPAGHQLIAEQWLKAFESLGL